MPVDDNQSVKAGEVMAWTGLPQLLVIPLVPLLMKRVDARLLVGTGLLVFAGSCFMNLYFCLLYTSWVLTKPLKIRGILRWALL